MQVIQTRYIRASDTKGSRIKAFAKAGSITIPYPHELSGQAAHRKAAEALAAKVGWKRDYLGGQLPNGDYAFVVLHDWSEQS